MSKAVLLKAIEEGRLICPTCSKPVKKYENLVEVADSVWDGAGDSTVESSGSKVTLICANSGCSWQERTEYWEDYIE